jgi:putative transcriptional regulator
LRNEIRELRAVRGISQASLAETLGVSRQTINAIETGRYMPSLPLAFALAGFFETTVEDLFEPEEGDKR